MNNKLKVVDLFSGCGGFSFGFQDAGFQVVLGVDNNKIALDTFKANHIHSDVLLTDLSDNRAIPNIIKKLSSHKIDVIIAGPPCQGFSLTGSRNQEDERNKLFHSVFLLAKEVKPMAVIIENVPGLASLYNGKAKDIILSEFRKLSFSCNNQVLYAPDYGVPQIRKRLFFVGLKKKYGLYSFPSKILTDDKYVGCSDAIGDLPSRKNEMGCEKDVYLVEPHTDYQKKMRKHSKFLYNHVGTKHTENVVHVISQVPEGGNYKNLPKGVGDSRKFNEAWTRYHSKKPSKTIDTGHRNHFHYKYNRVPTVRENARLQSFPDRFIFLGNKTEQYKQVGNAVPPLLGYYIAKKLLKYISNG